MFKAEIARLKIVSFKPLDKSLIVDVAAKKITLGVLVKAAPAEKPQPRGHKLHPSEWPRWHQLEEKDRLAIRSKLRNMLGIEKGPPGIGIHSLLGRINSQRRQAGITKEWGLDDAIGWFHENFGPDAKPSHVTTSKGGKFYPVGEKPEATPRAEGQRQVRKKIEELLDARGIRHDTQDLTGALLEKVNKNRQEWGMPPLTVDGVEKLIKEDNLAEAIPEAIGSKMPGGEKYKPGIKKPEVNIGVGAMPKPSSPETVAAALPLTDWHAWTGLDAGEAGRVRERMVAELKRQGVDVQEGWALQRLFAKWNKERRAQGLAAQGMKEIINLFNKPATGAAVKLGSDYLDEAGAEKEMEGHPNVAGLHLRESGERIAAQGIREALHRRKVHVGDETNVDYMLRVLNRSRQEEGKKPLRPIDFLPAVHGKTHWDFGSPEKPASPPEKPQWKKEKQEGGSTRAYHQLSTKEGNALMELQKQFIEKYRRYHPNAPSENNRGAIFDYIEPLDKINYKVGIFQLRRYPYPGLKEKIKAYVDAPSVDAQGGQLPEPKIEQGKVPSDWAEARKEWKRQGKRDAKPIAGDDLAARFVERYDKQFHPEEGDEKNIFLWDDKKVNFPKPVKLGDIRAGKFPEGVRARMQHFIDKGRWDIPPGGFPKKRGPGPGSSTSMDVHRRQVKEHEQRDQAYAYEQQVRAEASELAGRKRMEDWQGRRYHVGPGAGMTSRDVEVEQKQHEAMAERDRAMAHRRNIVREARNMEGDIDRRMTPRSAERAAWDDRAVMARQEADVEARARAEQVRERVGREAHEEEWFRRHGSDFTTPAGQKIMDLPLLPSHKNPRVRRHQRVDKREGGQRVLPKMWVDSEKLHFPVRGVKPKKFETEEAGQRMLPVVPRHEPTPWMGIGIRPGAKKEEDAAPTYRQRLVNELENIFHVQTYFHDNTDTLRQLLDEKRAEREVPPLEEKGGQAILPGRGRVQTVGKLRSAWGGTLEHETDEYGRRWLKKPVSLREGQKQAERKGEEEKKAASGKARGELQRLFVEKFKKFHPDATDKGLIFEGVTLADLAQGDLGNYHTRAFYKPIEAAIKKYVDAPTHDAMGHPLPEPTLEAPKIEEEKKPSAKPEPTEEAGSIKRKIGVFLNRRKIAWRQSDTTEKLLEKLNDARYKQGKPLLDEDDIQERIDKNGVPSVVKPEKVAPESKAKTVPPGPKPTHVTGGVYGKPEPKGAPKFGVAMKVKREGPATRGTLESEARKLGIERPNLLTAENLVRELEKRRPRTTAGGRARVLDHDVKLPKVKSEWKQEQLPGIGPKSWASAKRQKIKDALDSETVSGIRLRKENHANKSCPVKLGDGSDGYWKPANGEESGLRAGITSGTYYRRENVAGDIAEMVGMEDLVPASRERTLEGVDGDDSVGALMDYWDDELEDLADGHPGSYDDLIDNMDPWDCQRGAAWDFVLGNEDRHKNNAKVNSDGTRWCFYDNGLSLGHQNPDGIQSFLGRRAVNEGWQIDPKVKALWEGKWESIEQAMKDREIEDEAIDLAKDRYDALLATKKWGDLKKQNSHWYFYT